MLNLESAWNSLSFGGISWGIAKCLFDKKILPNIFPIGGNVDISAFDQTNDEFKLNLQNGINNSLKKYKKDLNYLRAWHINGSWHKVSEPSYLLTFSECDQITDTEVNILNSYSKVFVTSTFSKQVFEDYGVKVPVVYTPMGFDSTHFKKLDKPRPLGNDVVVMSAYGKFEGRKNHKEVIQTWLKHYKNNHKVRLHLFVTNPFLKQEQMNAIYSDLFQNERPPFNVTIFGFQPTNSLMNECYNATDIVLDLSGAESISICSLTCIALGKTGVILDASGMKDWLKFVDVVKLRPNGKVPIYDGIFFNPNMPFNQGNKYTFNPDEFIAGCEEAIKRFEQNPINESGFKLQEEYSYKKGVDIMLKEMGLAV